MSRTSSWLRSQWAKCLSMNWLSGVCFGGVFFFWAKAAPESRGSSRTSIAMVLIVRMVCILDNVISMSGILAARTPRDKQRNVRRLRAEVGGDRRRIRRGIDEVLSSGHRAGLAQEFGQLLRRVRLGVVLDILRQFVLQLRHVGRDPSHRYRNLDPENRHEQERRSGRGRGQHQRAKQRADGK